MVGPRQRSRRVAPPLGRAALLVSVAVLALAGWATAHPAPRASPTGVLQIQQSPNPLPNGSLTVSMKVANPSSVKLVYYSFCQLSQPICYTPPITMTLNATNWFVGSTKPMSSYAGMTPGKEAGYNITIEYANNTNVTEPHLPNAFSNLVVKTEVGGEYMFGMVVRGQVFALHGVVTDASSGRAISGATVTISPSYNTTTTDSTGAYVFTGLANGTYNLSVTDSGFTSRVTSIQINGTSVVKDVTLASTGGGSTSSWWSASFQGIPLLALLGGAIAVAVLVAIWGWGRRKRKVEPATPTVSGGSSPPASGSG